MRALLFILALFTLAPILQAAAPKTREEALQGFASDFFAACANRDGADVANMVDRRTIDQIDRVRHAALVLDRVEFSKLPTDSRALGLLMRSFMTSDQLRDTDGAKTLALLVSRGCFSDAFLKQFQPLGRVVENGPVADIYVGNTSQVSLTCVQERGFYRVAFWGMFARISDGLAGYVKFTKKPENVALIEMLKVINPAIDDSLFNGPRPKK